MTSPIKVLDKGYVEVVDHMGDDLRVVNAARVSFGTQSLGTLSAKDKKLLVFLAEHKHYSPFRHLMVTFRLKAPEFVMRQMYKHVVGIETTSSHPTKDHGWSEISQRYIPVTDYYLPYSYRAAPENKKQGSGPNLPEEMNMLCQEEAEMFMAKAFSLYDWMISSGVAPEQARIFLPLNIYTEVYWTASFQAIANFLELREAPDAQWEIREYAKAVRELVTPLFPEIMRAWFGEPDVTG